MGFHGAGMGGLLESVEDVFSHFLTAYRFPALGDIPRTKSRTDGFLDCIFDCRGRFFQSKTVAEHEGGT